MPRYRSTVAVPNPPDRAFAFVADLTNAARWDPQIRSAEKLTGAPVGPGTRFLLRARVLGLSLDLPYEIVGFAPGRELVVRGESRLFRYRDTIRFAPLAGGTRLSYDANISLRGPLGLGDPLLGVGFSRAARHAMEGLEQALVGEHRWSVSDLSARAAAWSGENAATPEAVREIVALDDRPELRNLLITHTYHELATRLARMLGRDNANWCAYATWASKTAGRFIRGEEVPREVRRLLDEKRRLRERLRELRRALRQVDSDADLYKSPSFDPIGDVVGEIALFITGGNKIVFAELGGLFAEFLAAHADDDARDPAKLRELLDRLRPGDSQPDEVRVDERRGELTIRERGGQDLLRSAFELYYEARFETDPNKKAEAILLANALSGLHEQTRLQAYIEGGLNAPVDETIYSRHNDALAQRLAADVLGRAQRVLDRHFRPVGEELTEIVREVATGFLMSLESPGEVLKLGEDLPAKPGRPLFPPLLADIRSRALSGVLRRYGALGAGASDRRAAGSAARDWSDLDQRMRFIFNYFRSRQGEPRLLEAPFDAEQTAAILQGKIPGGRL